MENDDIYVESYRLISKLGSGAFGHVYKAQHAILPNRIVALKLMRPDHAENEEAIIRFLMESQLLEKLRHAYILPIINAGIHTRTLFTAISNRKIYSSTRKAML